MPSSSQQPTDGAHSPTNTFGEMLQKVDLFELISRPTEPSAHSPLNAYAHSQRSRYLSSPTLSIRSDDSVDSIISLSASAGVHEGEREPQSAEQLETNDLIYKLCRSLYKKVVQKTKHSDGGSGKHSSRNRRVSVDERREKNMSHMTDWMPLLHLFDPKTFYAYRNTKDVEVLPAISENPVANGVARNPHEASQQLLDELDVEKLSGGNSNHVYRLASTTFPDKAILLRVYGSGDDEAIDRLRDVTAMKLMSKSSLSPAVLHSFKWGRVEEFMDSVATCTTDMLIASTCLLSEVFGVLGETHRLPYDAFLPEVVNRIRWRDTVIGAFFDSEECGDPEEYCRVNAARMRDTLASASETDYYHDGVDVKVMEEICPSAFERASLRFLRLSSPLLRPEYRRRFERYIIAEIVSLRSALQRRSVPLVFSHNDLNPGNILLSWRKVPDQFRSTSTVDTYVCDDGDEVTAVVSEMSSPLSRKFLTRKGHHRNLVDLKGVVFIDFEYSDVNYRCFDLGNTLCELDYDYSRGVEDGGPGFIKYLHTFPPESHRDAWAGLPKEYPRLPQLIHDSWRAASAGETVTHSGMSCLRAIGTYFGCKDSGESASNSFTADQLSEVLLGMLTSHMYWALWSFVLACNPDQRTNNTDDDDGFARGSSGLDYISYGNCRLREYISLKAWMDENQLL